MAFKKSVCSGLQVASWDNIFEKDYRVWPEARGLTFWKNAKSIFSKDNTTLCSSLRRILRLPLNIDVSVSIMYILGSGIVPTKHLLVYFSRS
ncbi:TIGR01777 family protein [Sesbania bispinosa]|nr:TIGR01777 family protein [Sesbania bispinosa]